VESRHQYQDGDDSVKIFREGDIYERLYTRSCDGLAAHGLTEITIPTKIVRGAGMAQRLDNPAE